MRSQTRLRYTYEHAGAERTLQAIRSYEMDMEVRTEFEEQKSRRTVVVDCEAGQKREEREAQTIWRCGEEAKWRRTWCGRASEQVGEPKYFKCTDTSHRSAII
jgi:hypothetical protein